MVADIDSERTCDNLLFRGLDAFQHKAALLRFHRGHGLALEVSECDRDLVVSFRKFHREAEWTAAGDEITRQRVILCLPAFPETDYGTDVRVDPDTGISGSCGAVAKIKFITCCLLG